MYSGLKVSDQSSLRVFVVFFSAEAYVSFVEPQYSVSEGAESVSVCLELSNVEFPLQEDLSVMLQTSPATALGICMFRYNVFTQRQVQDF